MRACSIPLWLVFLLAAGCNGKPTPVPAGQALSAKAQELGKRIDGLRRPVHVTIVEETIYKCETQEVREGKWARNLTLAGWALGALVVLAAVAKVLGAL